MNAYEISKKLENVGSKYYREVAAALLRQQSDRIAELEKCLLQMQNACIYLNNLLSQDKK